MSMTPPSAVQIDGGYVVKRSPGRVHPTFDKAATEAERLTTENPGWSFMVLKIRRRYLVRHRRERRPNTF